MAANILLIETSGDICSTALLVDREVIAEKSINEKNSHSRELAPMVDALLKENRLETSDLSAIAISAGPGSYTGLRIAASLAKGLCFAANIPLIAVSSLSAIGYAMREGTKAPGLYHTLIDARREDAYTALFDENMALIEPEEFLTITESHLAERLKEEMILFGGSGAEKALQIIKHPNALFTDVEVHARHLATEAYKAYTHQQFEDLSYFEPNYIKSVHVTKPKNPVKK